jgi:hypothetical protein
MTRISRLKTPVASKLETLIHHPSADDLGGKCEHAIRAKIALSSLMA